MNKTELRTELAAKKRQWYNNVLKWNSFFNRMTDITTDLIHLGEDIEKIETEIYGEVKSDLHALRLEKMKENLR